MNMLPSQWIAFKQLKKQLQNSPKIKIILNKQLKILHALLLLKFHLHVLTEL